MKTFRNLLLIYLIVLGAISASFGQSIILKQSNESGIYHSGEQIQLTVLLDGIEADSVKLKVLKNYTEELQNQQIDYLDKQTVLFTGSYSEPTSLIFEVSTGEQSASLGLVVNPDGFQPGTKAPKDLKSFWENERKALRALPMEVKSEAMDSIKEGYAVLDVEINSTGPKPARGYFAKPLDAKPKSLPIVLFVHAAGVSDPWCLSQPENAMRYAERGNGALSFDLNAHGMLNGQPLSYYQELEKGELAGYFYQGLESKEDFYFRGMYLRLMRTLDFLTSQPEWDGKRIIVIGESQGGGQALVAAGLDKRVTAAIATVPAMADFAGTLIDRKGGWPDPFAKEADKEKMMETLPYFDAAHLLKNSKVTLVTEIGFIDMTCSSVSIYAAINQSKGDKITIGVPYRAHQLAQKSHQEEWQKNVYDKKMAFLAEFLK